MDLKILQDLKARVDAASGPDWRIDMDVENVFGEWKHLGGHWKQHKVTGARVHGVNGPSPPVSASIDAAVSLTERVLPGWAWRIGFYQSDGFNARMTPRATADEAPEFGSDNATSAPLAILSALLAALIAQEGDA